MLLASIRTAGGDLHLGKGGTLLATAGAQLEYGYGVEIYTERKAEFVAILTAEAKLLAPVRIA